MSSGAFSLSYCFRFTEVVNDGPLMKLLVPHPAVGAHGPGQ